MGRLCGLRRGRLRAAIRVDESSRSPRTNAPSASGERIDDATRVPGSRPRQLPWLCAEEALSSEIAAQLFVDRGSDILARSEGGRRFFTLSFRFDRGEAPKCGLVVR